LITLLKRVRISVMVGSTRSEKAEVENEERETTEDMERLQRVADMIGGTLETVCRMQEQERNELLQVLDLAQVAHRGEGEEGSPESSRVESSQEPRPNKRSKLRKSVKSKRPRTSTTQSGRLELNDGGGVETVSDARKQEVSHEKLVAAEVEEVDPAIEREVCESDNSSACTTDPYTEDTGCDSENRESHGNILLREGEAHSVPYASNEAVSVAQEKIKNDESQLDSKLVTEELINGVQEVHVTQFGEMDNGDEHIAGRKRIDESNRIQFSTILTEIIAKEKEMARGNLMMRLLPIFKQRSASPIGNSATLKCLEPGQVLKVKTNLAIRISQLTLYTASSERWQPWVFTTPALLGLQFGFLLSTRRGPPG